jgi:alcohol dehydrogenase (cytochrome c)
MKTTFAMTLALLLIAACATSTTEQTPPAKRAGPGPTQAELNNAGRNTDEVLTYGMSYNHNRYSPLAQINRGNIKRLVPVWNVSLQNDLGEQAQPMIYDGVMFVSNARWTYAIDALTGAVIWRTAVNYDPGTPSVVCCGVSNKGVAIFEGKVFRTTLDAHVVALDMKTGKEVWKHKVAEWKEGYSQTVAPLVANGVVITGCSGAEFGTRCFLDGWDPHTGKKLWRRYTTAGPGEKGHETWEPRETYLNGGASTWITGSYDPELDLVYWGTGNAGPWNGDNRKGDNLYAASVIAIRPKTGEIAWHYQFAPNDVWDWDSWEMIQAEIPVNGQKRKVVMHVARNGFLYVLDRTNGQLLSAKPYEKVNWATHIDMATGRPVESEESRKLRRGEVIDMWPSINGAKNWGHAAFNPNTGLLYVNTNHSYSTYKFIPLGPYKPGARYQFIENKYPPTPKDTPSGHMEAIDPMTGKAKWRTPLIGQRNMSAMLATGGGLLFTGKNTGEFIALDADTGNVVWSFKTGSGINAQAITWTRNGKQYVTILSGLGGVTSGRRGLPDTIPLGGSVWTFALLD